MDDKTLDFVKRLAKAMAAQFGGNCEVVVHDLNTGDPERTIAAIENGHVSRRRVGDGRGTAEREAEEIILRLPISLAPSGDVPSASNILSRRPTHRGGIFSAQKSMQNFVAFATRIKS